MYKLGQIMLLIGVLTAIGNGILIWSNKLDTKISSIVFVFSLILLGVGKYLSKKK